MTDSNKAMQTALKEYQEAEIAISDLRWRQKDIEQYLVKQIIASGNNHLIECLKVNRTMLKQRIGD